MTRWSGYAVLLSACGAAVLAASAWTTEPAGVPCAMAGSHVLSCTSKWHSDTVLTTPLSGSVVFAQALREAILHPPADPGQTYSLPAAEAEAFGKKLAEIILSQVFSSEWYGSDTQEQETVVSCSLSASWEVTPAEAEPAKVKITGGLKIAASGRVASRYGPNMWQEEWDLPIEGSAVIAHDGAGAAGLSLVLRGTVRGRFHSGTPDEPYTATVTLEAASLICTDEDKKQLDALVAELGHDAFARREAATQEAKALGPHLRQLLIERLRASDDPELRYRAELLEAP